MGTATEYTVVRVEGDTYPFEINVRRGSSPYDLTGASATLTIGKNIPDANAVSMAATTVEGSKATFVLTQPIYDLPANSYFGQIQITDANSYVWTPLQFRWVVKPAI